MSDCGCVWVECGDECIFYKAARPRARIEHSCGECERKILPGETYERVAGKWEHGFFTSKTCTDCLSMRNSFFCENYAYGFLWEDLWDHINGLDGKISSSCIVPLTPRAREKVCGMIERAWRDE